MMERISQLAKTVSDLGKFDKNRAYEYAEIIAGVFKQTKNFDYKKFLNSCGLGDLNGN